MTIKPILTRTKRMFNCESVRVVEFAHTPNKYVVIGFKRRSKGQWVRYEDGKNAKPVNFDYLEEHCIAHGKTWNRLWESVKYYKRLEKMSALDYFLDVISGKAA